VATFLRRFCVRRSRLRNNHWSCNCYSVDGHSVLKRDPYAYDQRIPQSLGTVLRWCLKALGSEKRYQVGKVADHFDLQTINSAINNPRERLMHLHCTSWHFLALPGTPVQQLLSETSSHPATIARRIFLQICPPLETDCDPVMQLKEPKHPCVTKLVQCSAH